MNSKEQNELEASKIFDFMEKNMKEKVDRFKSQFELYEIANLHKRHQWYVGITGDLETRINQHEEDGKQILDGFLICVDCGTAEIAKIVEKKFGELEVDGAKEGNKGANENSKFVYAFLYR